MLCISLLTTFEIQAADEINFGEIKNSVYQNNYFKMSATIPKGWSVQTQKSQKEILDRGGKMAAGDDKNLKAMIKATELQIVNLFAAFKHPQGSPVDYNPSIMSIAEKVSHLPGITRGKDYHFHTKRVLQSTQMQVSFPKEVYTKQIDGIDFDVMIVNMTSVGQTIKQKQYVSIIKGYALIISITYTTDEDEAELDKALQSIHFQS
jgi:hypothetical protein